MEPGGRRCYRGAAIAALGVAGELRELRESKTTDEVGDLLYYVTSVRRLLDIGHVPPHARVPYVEAWRDAAATACKLAEEVKKHVAHGNDWLTEIHKLTCNLYGYCLHEASKLGATLDDVRAENAEKVLGRFPDGFDHDRTEKGKDAPDS